MTTYTNRTNEERETIRKAYQFEVTAIANDSWERNPYLDDLKKMKDWVSVWGAINEAVAMTM